MESGEVFQADVLSSAPSLFPFGSGKHQCFYLINLTYLIPLAGKMQ